MKNLIVASLLSFTAIASAKATELVLNPGDHTTIHASEETTVSCKNLDPNAPQLPYCSIAVPASNGNCASFVGSPRYTYLCVMVGQVAIAEFNAEDATKAGDRIKSYRESGVCR